MERYIIIVCVIFIICLLFLLLKSKKTKKTDRSIPQADEMSVKDALIKCMNAVIEEDDEVNGIHKLLEIIGEFYGASRAYLFEVGEKSDFGSYRGEWCAEGVESHEFFFGETSDSDEKSKAFMQKMPKGAFMKFGGDENNSSMPDMSNMGDNSIWMKNYDKNGDFCLASIDSVKFSNPLMYMALKVMNISGLMSTLIKNDDKVQAIVGIENPTKNTDTMDMIHVVSSFVLFRVNRDREIIKEYLLDSLTGVNSSRYINFWKKNCKPQFPFSVIVCDCNYLKRFNDVYGHKSGDLLLSKAGDILRACTPENSKVIRTGGDEFLVLCDNTDEQKAHEIMDSITLMAKNNAINGLPVSLALGSCTAKEEEYDFEQMRNVADSRMYKMKTEMKKTDQEENTNYIDESENRFKDIIGSMPVVMYYKDIECKYRFLTYYNSQCLKDEYKDQYGIGYTDLDIQKNEENGRYYYEDDQRVLTTGKGSFYISKVETDDGVMYFHTSKSAVIDENGKIVGIAGIVTDVTSTKVDFSEKMIRE